MKAQSTAWREALWFANNRFNNPREKTPMLGVFDGIDSQLFRNSQMQIYDISQSRNHTANTQMIGMAVAR
jgi:hypothetical protein